MTNTATSRQAGGRAVLLLGAVWLATGGVAATAGGTVRPADPDRQTVTGIEFLGEVTFPTGFSVGDTEVGGLSALAYDAGRKIYYALSDDRSTINPARYYSLSIDLSDGTLESGDIEFLSTTRLLDAGGSPFPPNSLDPEGLAFLPGHTLFVASEGDAGTLIDPFVNEFGRSGRQKRELTVPDAYLPVAGGTSGIRNNLAFESLTLTPAKDRLFTATENALQQDGPAADIDVESLSRILELDRKTGEPLRECVYPVGPVPEVPNPADGFRTNGLVELLALDNNGTFLALERAFSTGVGNRVKLYEVTTQGALDISSELSLFNEDAGVPFEIDPPVGKRELLDIANLGVVPDNLEGMALGPLLPDGRRTLILVSDNNFSTTQVTQFLAFALETKTLGAALPMVETPRALDDPERDAPLQGDSDDPAIWVHPSRPEASRVIATQKDGGLVVFDLQGRIRQIIAPEVYGAIRYNNVDLVYGFPFAAGPADIAVVSDRANDTLAVYRIDPRSGRLRDITSPTMPSSIFGVDDGEVTAYGLATYRSPRNGASYAFVTQAGGNRIAQLELAADARGRVTARVIRSLELPVPTGDPEDSQAEGMVVDRELGILFVALETELGILKFPAEPADGNSYELVASIDEADLKPDIEGLTIYYGPNGSGYLLVSSQGDSSYAVFERAAPHRLLGRFIIGDNRNPARGGYGYATARSGRHGTNGYDDPEDPEYPVRTPIDQVNESDGADVINVPLGRAFPYGLLVVQDGANDPQAVARDDEELENISTNFKLVPWEQVARTLPEPLLIAPDGYHPR